MCWVCVGFLFNKMNKPITKTKTLIVTSKYLYLGHFNGGFGIVKNSSSAFILYPWKLYLFHFTFYKDISYLLNSISIIKQQLPTFTSFSNNCIAILHRCICLNTKDKKKSQHNIYYTHLWLVLISSRKDQEI